MALDAEAQVATVQTLALWVALGALGLGIALMPPTDGVAERHELLRGLATVGSGLLLLRAGAFPRRNTYLAEHVLAAEESLRLNTALLSDGQKGIFLKH